MKNLNYLLGTLLTLGSIISCFSQQKKSNSKQPLVVFVIGDHEYSSEKTLPIVAEELEKNYGMKVKVLKSYPDHMSEENIPGLEALKDADLAVFFLRWRRLPAEQIKFIDDYLKSGKAVMGFRTSTHAFNYPKGHPLEKWNSFSQFALGGPPGWEVDGHNHYGHESSTDVTIIEKEAKNPILTGVSPSFHCRSWLYNVLPNYPAKGATWLLMGKAVNPNRQATDNPVAWTWKNEAGGKVFTTTLGHPEDFNLEAFQRLVINAIHWSVDKPVPQKWAGKMNINVPYDSH